MTSKLATFRIDDELWQQFQDIAKQNGTTASALLVGFVQGVVKTECIDDKPKVSIQNIDTAINSSIQSLDELIDNKIKLSIQDGDIKDKVADVYAQGTTNLNEVLEQTNQKFQELEQRLKKLNA